MKQDIEIESLLADFEKFHSQFQIDNFIIGRAGDDWARYKQALREISTRKNNLINMREQMELDEIGPPVWKRATLWLRPKRVRQIHAAKRRRSRLQMAGEIAEIDRELARFVELAKRLRKNLGELTPDRRRELEAQTWFNKARQLILIDSIVNGGQPSATTVDFILGLPLEMQSEVLSIFGQAKPLDNRQNFNALDK